MIKYLLNKSKWYRIVTVFPDETEVDIKSYINHLPAVESSVVVSPRFTGDWTANLPLLTYIMSGLRSSLSQTEHRQRAELHWRLGLVMRLREERIDCNYNIKNPHHHHQPPCLSAQFPPESSIFSPALPVRKPGGGCGRGGRC